MKEKTALDGSDLAIHLNRIFTMLNTPVDQRPTNGDGALNQFPALALPLFEERLVYTACDSGVRTLLLQCGTLRWSAISPAIFGSLFQQVMHPAERRTSGAHYTSEETILKVLRPLCLDRLYQTFHAICCAPSALKTQRLRAFQHALTTITFLDPACGCGNFLLVSYRELRKLEITVLKALLKEGQTPAVTATVTAAQCYGIELEELPAQIARAALGLIDYGMQRTVAKILGTSGAFAPSRPSPRIIQGNALTMDWEHVVSKKTLTYIVGNPPFLGKKEQSSAQKADIKRLFHQTKGRGVLDYVTGWYKKAAEYIQGTDITVSFVSTNSICQGEQVSVLWKELMEQYGIKIHFAHQAFLWTNETKKRAAVWCIIVGFSACEQREKKLFVYTDLKAKPRERSVTQINAYLTDTGNIFIPKRKKPIAPVPEMFFGNMPADGGNLLFTLKEKIAFLEEEPAAAQYIKPLISAREFLNNSERFCLWLKDVELHALKQYPALYRRIETVRALREHSSRPRLAAFPHLFAQITQPAGKPFLLIPSTSSSTRTYIPIALFSAGYIAHNSCHIIPEAGLYEFGILTSAMHNAWVRAVCGRLGNGYRYSKDIVYNNFPWPVPVGTQRASIENAAQEIITVRNQYPHSPLTILYNPLTMPPDLVRVHRILDKAVEHSYARPFKNDNERIAYLFNRYQNVTGE
ncbi:MAG: N-6 DNA methylase [Treponema sp.]|nr:N-6 DNA methylase [Treponema sp.]